MNIIEILAVSISLALDTFAVSVCKGLSMKNMDWKKAIIIGLYFGGFQALMPIIGFNLCCSFENMVTQIDHWIAFGLLFIIGINMIRESVEDDSKKINDNTDIKTMLLLSIATSIDALAIGITFAFLDVNIILSVFIIGLTSLVLSIIGVKIGNKFGNKYGKISEIIGGIVLIFIGIKILLEHLKIF